MYYTITNPLTNKKVNFNTKEGHDILEYYLNTSLKKKTHQGSYKYIFDPKINKKININSERGENILIKYIISYQSATVN
jgi:hypothetical protein